MASTLEHSCSKLVTATLSDVLMRLSCCVFAQSSPHAVRVVVIVCLSTPNFACSQAVYLTLAFAGSACLCCVPSRRLTVWRSLSSAGRSHWTGMKTTGQYCTACRYAASYIIVYCCTALIIPRLGRTVPITTQLKAAEWGSVRRSRRRSAKCTPGCSACGCLLVCGGH